jgi:ubiquitin carboxyl-terminal hydrolase L3
MWCKHISHCCCRLKEPGCGIHTPPPTVYYGYVKQKRNQDMEHATRGYYINTMMDSTTPIITDNDASNEGGDNNISSSNNNHKWFPLESNPTLMNQYISTMGWDTEQYHIVDVYSTDDWALEMIPQPVIAVLLLYPLTKVQLQHEQREKEQLMKTSTTTTTSSTSINDVWFMKQRIGNACGTIGLLHAMMNVPSYLHQLLPKPLIQPNSWLDKFVQQTTTSITDTTQNNHPIRIAEILENDTTIASLHDAATSSIENQTVRGDIDDDVITHFIAFVRSKDSNSNVVYELDGRKVQPIAHVVPSSSTTTTNNNNNTLLYDACTIIQEQFMARDPNELRFTILAFAPNQDDE